MKIAILRPDHDERSRRQLDDLRSLGLSSVKFGDDALVLASDAEWRALERDGRMTGVDSARVVQVPRKRDLRLVIQIGRRFQQEHPDVRVLFDRGRYLVVELDSDQARQIGKRSEPDF